MGDVQVTEHVSRVGQQVLYTLNESDATAINRRREDHDRFRRMSSDVVTPGIPAATGHIGHVGNPAAEGQQYPAVIVRDFVGSVNLQVLLDGNDTFWATSRAEGDGPFHWQRLPQ